MNEDTLNYEEWVEEALRAVIKRSLEQTVLDGLLGEHHFFITFLTGHRNVEIPAHLLTEHPEKMTIVLQHQFNDLEVTDVGFSVSLSFGGRPCYLQVPFSSIVTFADPAVNFVLQLKMAEQNNEEAIYWNQRASDLGFSIASYNMGFFYYSGLAGLEQDLIKAKKYWLLCASQWIEGRNNGNSTPKGLLEEINFYNKNPNKEMLKLRDWFIDLLKSISV